MTAGGDQDRDKRAAAEHAAAEVQPGMVVGLGAGTTAAFAVTRIADRFAKGQLAGISCVPCSTQVEALAARLGLPLTTLDEHPALDLTIDGADEVAPSLDLIKGAGGALLREKMVAQASRREIIAVDGSKLVTRLGSVRAVPVEVVEFGWGAQVDYLTSLGAKVMLRTASAASAAPFRTDGGHLILDCAFGPIDDPARLAARLDARAGVVEHGLFIGLATEVVVAEAGAVRQLRPGPGGGAGPHSPTDPGGHPA